MSDSVFQGNTPSHGPWHASGRAQSNSQDQVAVALHDQVGRSVHGVERRVLHRRSSTPRYRRLTLARNHAAGCKEVGSAGCRQGGWQCLVRLAQAAAALTWGRFWLARRVPGVVGVNPVAGGADVAGALLVTGGTVDRGFAGTRGSSATGTALRPPGSMLHCR